MAIDIKGLNRKELEQLKAKIEKQLDKIAASDKKAALLAAEKAAKQHGFSLSDIMGAPAPGKTKSKPAKKGTPQYAHPENVALTWTGKGRQPQWFKDHVEAGGDPEKLRIKT